jgi:Glycine/D-amino acid oxidases (deaminating)
MSEAIVLGAGFAGVSAALHLQKRGWNTVLVDRNGIGRETSYGNAGIIQSEAVEPYGMPRDWQSLFAIATGTSNDVSYSLATLPRHLPAILRYWWHSAPARHRRIAAAYAAIIRHATTEHEPLIAEAEAEDLIQRGGFRVLFRSTAAFDNALATARRLNAEYGVPYTALAAEDFLRAEPALRSAGVGGVHWLSPWTVADPGALAEAYGRLLVRLGGRIVSGDASTLSQTQTGGWRVLTEEGMIDAPHVVVALGPWSAGVLSGFGYRFTMVRKRGYHRHYRSPDPLHLPIQDSANGYVLAPMRAGTRITTGAELMGDAGLPAPSQLARAERAAAELMDLGAPVENAPWSGVRPCMPDMLPVVGAAPRHKGLWFHFGHGHQGLTLGPASARLLAELMTDDRPVVDPVPFSPDRLFRS